MGSFYDKILAFAGQLRGAVAAKVDATSIAPEFSATSTYAVGAVVMHEGVRYKCTTAVSTAGAWNAANWTAESVEAAIPYSQTLHILAAGTTSIALADHSGDYYDATALTSSDTVAVTLPAVTSGKVSDCVITIETGSSVPTLNFGLAGDVFIAADSSWATLTASAYNVITLTSAGASGKWTVGRITTAK